MVDRKVKVRLEGDVSDYNRSMLGATATTRAMSKELDSASGRFGILAQSAAALGPALVPLTAAAIPAVSGLTNQLGFAAAGAGVAALAFQGVGDALGAVNDYSLDPTTANLEKMQEALDRLGPAGQEFVRYLDSLRPKLHELQSVAQEGLFPGVESGLRDIMQLLPQAESIVSTVATSLGDLVAEAGDNLNDPRWREWFDWLESEARPTLMDMGHTLGNFTEGFANLWQTFDPLSDDFSRSFLQLSRDFREWTDGLSETEGFADFVRYIREVGPQAWDTLGALSNALLQVVEAAAPIGEATLPVIEALADGLAAIADSPAGPVLIGTAAGMAALSRAIAVTNVVKAQSLAGTLERFGGMSGVLRGAAGGVGLLAASMSDLDDKAGLTNTAIGASIGLLGGPWGAAVGGGVGFALDFAAANDDVAEATERASRMIADNSGTIEDQAAALQSAQQKLEDYKNRTPWENLIPIVGPFISKYTDDTDDLTAALKRAKDQYQQNKVEAQRLALQHDSLAGRTELVGDSVAGFGNDMKTTAQKADGLKTALDNLLDPMLDQDEAAVAWQRALLELRKGMSVAKDGSDHLVTSLSKFTAAGQDNRDTLRGNVEALVAKVNADAAAGKSADKLAGEVKRGKKALLDAAGAAGFNRDKVKALIEQYGLTPKLVKTVIKQSGADKAKGDADKLSGALHGLAKTKATPGVDLKGKDKTEHDLNDVERMLVGLPPGKPEVEVQGIPQALRKTHDFAGAFKRSLAGIADEDVNINVAAQLSKSLGSTWDWLAGASGHASGGPIKGYGTTNHAPPLTEGNLR